jgi:ABC-type multidrug transport system fused ATPase/permease subunit
VKYIFYFIKRLHSNSGSILYFNLLGMGLVSFLDGIGIFLLIPMLTFGGFLGEFNIENPLFEFLKGFQSLPVSALLPLILMIFIVLNIGQYLLQRNLTIRNVKIISGFMNNIRLENYQSLLKASWSFFLRKRNSDLINVLTLEIPRVTGGINTFLQLVSSAIFTLIQVGLAFWISPSITIFMILCGLLLSFFSRRFIKKSKLLGNKTSKLAEEYLSGITDQLNGIKDIKSNNLEDSRMIWLKSLTNKLFEEQLEHIRLKTSSQLFYKVFSTLIIAFFIFFSVKMFHSKPDQFLLVLVIFSRLWPRMTGIQSNLEQLASSIPAFKKLIDLKVECTEEAEIGFQNHIKEINLKKGIECHNLCFRYNKNEEYYALNNINLKIPINFMTAIVGRSGAGKSTLIDILMGLNKPESGNVLIDGAPLNKENLLSVRRLIGYVPQDPFLFNGSIRDNLLLIKPSATEQQLWEALEFSAAASFVNQLPNGLDTIIGDRGIRLSGGERQRIVLARAILRKPAILILDEATSSLDTENESKIQKALERLKGSMTIIVIAHRLSTIRNADQVIVLDQGEIIQQGQYNQLAIDKKGMFNTLLRKQLGVSV